MLSLALALLGPPPPRNVSFGDVLRLEARAPDARIAYGSEPQQHGELWLPKTPSPHAVAVVIHGGCWRSAFGQDHVRPMCAALAAAGVAAWCLEYRRVGEAGGGWPGTFHDVARGADHVRDMAGRHGLDPTRVVAVGHSAGGHLALWLAARRRLKAGDPLRGGDPLPLRGVVALAAIPDLERAAADAVCGNSVPALMGGAPDQQPLRYGAASPAALLPLGVPQVLLHGGADRLVPLALSEAYVAAAMLKGDRARLVALPDAGHFDLIDPDTRAWPSGVQAVTALLK